MLKIVVFSSSNYIANSGNTYTYSLPQTYKSQVGDQIGIASVSMYNTTFNISSARGNNSIQLIWNAGTTTTYTFTIPDGYYSVSDLNNFLQQQMILNNLYCTTNSGSQNVYFAEVQVNAVRYSISLNLYYLPTSANATTLGYSIPSGATWTFPVSNKTPQITINSSFGNLIGQNAGTYPSSVSASNVQFISTKTPVISPIDSYIMTCNLINNPFSIPNNVFFTLPITASLGSLIISNSSEIIYNDIAPNTYGQIVIQLYDQLYNKLTINDYSLTITLSIRLTGEK